MSTTNNGVSPRDRTRQELFQIIQTRPDAATRADLIELTGLSRSTINHAIGRLLNEGRIVETNAEEKGPGSGSGRPGVRLRAVGVGQSVAAIDFGHNHVHVAVTGPEGEIAGQIRVDVDVDLDAEDAMTTATDLLSTLREDHGVDRFALVVAGVPGPLDTTTGLVRSPTILSGWVGLAPAQELSRRLGVAVHVENDAVLGALGELRRGAGRHHRDFLYVKASHGIGAGLVLNGQPYRGGTGLAGEIGHTPIPGHAELCRCGNRGCLEAAVSAEAIRAQIAHSHPNLEPAQRRLGVLHDTTTQRILSEAGRTLGRVLADMCNLLNPTAVIVGGELGTAGTELVDGIQDSIERYTQPATAATLEVIPAELGDRAELTGALELALQRASDLTARSTR